MSDWREEYAHLAEIYNQELNKHTETMGRALRAVEIAFSFFESNAEAKRDEFRRAGLVDELEAIREKHA